MFQRLEIEVNPITVTSFYRFNKSKTNEKYIILFIYPNFVSQNDITLNDNKF